MKHIQIVLIAVISVIAIISASFVYLNNNKPIQNADISVDVVYAYIGHPTVSSDTSGLYYNATEGNSHYSLASYVVVLKVINNADEMATLTNFRVFVAPQMIWNSVGFNQSNGQPAPGGLGEPSLEISNALISDQRAALPSGKYLSYQLSGDSSRLIALTGMISLSSFSEQNLQNGTLYVYGSATAEPGYANVYDPRTEQSKMAHSLKQVSFYNVEGDYLYNQLTGANQTLVVDGLEATVLPNGYYQ